MTSPVPTLNIKLYRNDTFDVTFTWLDAQNVAIDITGYTAKFQIRKKELSVTSELSLTESAGITLGGTEGTVRVVITAAQAALAGFTKGVYDLELTSGGGAVTTISQGSATVEEDVSR
jgi:hypothetical protein